MNRLAHVLAGLPGTLLRGLAVPLLIAGGWATPVLAAARWCDERLIWWAHQVGRRRDAD